MVKGIILRVIWSLETSVGNWIPVYSSLLNRSALEIKTNVCQNRYKGLGRKRLYLFERIFFPVKYMNKRNLTLHNTNQVQDP